jgi:CRISPR-associated endonuclease/helicase Cas3
MHDWGKADERFQALLRGGNRILARMHPLLLAKSGEVGLSIGERRRQRKMSELPDLFRHEFLSLQMADSGKGGSISGDRDVVLHQIAAHHGWARPFAPVSIDQEKPGIRLRLDGVNLRLSQDERAAMTPAHRIGSGVADRFWRLTRRFGWWGLAYLEAVFRLADWSASDKGAHEKEQKVAA